MTNMWKEIFEQPEVMEKSRLKNEATILSIVEQVNAYNPHTVVFAGRGTSDHAGQYGKYLIEIYKGIPVSLASPSVLCDYGGKLNFKGCLVIGISQSGKTEDVYEVLKAANAQGALTVSITNDPDSPVAKEASYHLCCEAGPELSVAATKTFAAQIYLLYNLVAQWTQSAELLGNVESIPGLVRQALAMSDKIDNMVQRCRFMREMFILARGITYPIAMEAGLKMNESSYTRARPYSISDFHHGPIAMVEKDTPVMIIDTDGNTRNDIRPLLKRLEPAQAELFAITTDAALAQNIASCIVLPPECTGPVSAFCVMALAQMFACKLAVLKGDNPDKPRGLKKITG